MKKISKVKFIFITVFLFGIFGWVKSSRAAITLPYSTSALSCGDFTQTNNYSGPTGCDGINVFGAWQCDSSHGMQINSSANYSGGAGGKGFRFWYGNVNNQGSGDVEFTFSPASELWVRHYARWEPGFNGSGIFQKLMYMYTNNNHQVLMDILGPTGCLFTNQGSSGTACYTDPTTGCNIADWKSTCGTSVTGFDGTNHSTGAWTVFEHHYKTNTSGSNGIYEFWINNVLVYQKTNLNFGGGSIDRILFPENGKTLNNTVRNGSSCWYYDQDDFAFSTTGRIGPLGGGGGGDTTPPAAPTGLVVN